LTLTGFFIILIRFLSCPPPTTVSRNKIAVGNYIYSEGDVVTKTEIDLIDSILKYLKGISCGDIKTRLYIYKVSTSFCPIQLRFLQNEILQELINPIKKNLKDFHDSKQSGITNTSEKILFNIATTLLYIVTHDSGRKFIYSFEHTHEKLLDRIVELVGKSINWNESNKRKRQRPAPPSFLIVFIRVLGDFFGTSWGLTRLLGHNIHKILKVPPLRAPHKHKPVFM